MDNLFPTSEILAGTGSPCFVWSRSGWVRGDRWCVAVGLGQPRIDHGEGMHCEEPECWPGIWSVRVWSWVLVLKMPNIEFSSLNSPTLVFSLLVFWEEPLEAVSISSFVRVGWSCKAVCCVTLLPSVSLSCVHIVSFILQTAFVYTNPFEPYRKPRVQGVVMCVCPLSSTVPTSKMPELLTGTNHYTQPFMS